MGREGNFAFTFYELLGCVILFYNNFDYTKTKPAQRIVCVEKFSFYKKAKEPRTTQQLKLNSRYVIFQIVGNIFFIFFSFSSTPTFNIKNCFLTRAFITTSLHTEVKR